MNVQTINRASGAGVGIILVGGLFAVLTLVVKLTAPAPEIDSAAAASRYQALVEIRTNEAAQLSTLGWADQSRGLVRLPIDTAIQLTASKWQNPAAARAELNARAEAAAAPVAPAAPKPSSFE
jgi:hypothetical protein